jgi:hypothetical protein
VLPIWTYRSDHAAIVIDRPESGRWRGQAKPS